VLQYFRAAANEAGHEAARHGAPNAMPLGEYRSQAA